MIEEHWALSRRPFANPPDPAIVYRTSPFKERFVRGARLGELHRNGRRPVLVVEETQLARPSLLEEIRLADDQE